MLQIGGFPASTCGTSTALGVKMLCFALNLAPNQYSVSIRGNRYHRPVESLYFHRLPGGVGCRIGPDLVAVSKRRLEVDRVRALASFHLQALHAALSPGGFISGRQEITLDTTGICLETRYR